MDLRAGGSCGFHRSGLARLSHAWIFEVGGKLGSQGRSPRLWLYRGSLISCLDRKEVPCLTCVKVEGQLPEGRMEISSQRTRGGGIGVKKVWLGRVQRLRDHRCCGDFWDSSS